MRRLALLMVGHVSRRAGSGRSCGLDQPGRARSSKRRATRKQSLHSSGQRQSIHRMSRPNSTSARPICSSLFPVRSLPGTYGLRKRRSRTSSRALNLEPSNKVALASLASLALSQKKWDDAQQWYEKLAASDPTNADAWYSMGFIAWSKWYPAYATARASLGMRPEEAGPIKDGGVRADLQGRYGAVLESGLRAFEKALEINPQYDDAMAYMNLLIRERADLRETAEEYKRDSRGCGRLGNESAGDQEGKGRAAECQRDGPSARRLRRAFGSPATWSNGNAARCADCLPGSGEAGGRPGSGAAEYRDRQAGTCIEHQRN